MIKKILYIGSYYEGGLASSGDSLNKLAFYHSFIKLGYKVRPVWYDTNQDGLDEAIENAVKEFQPDLVFTILQSDQISKPILTFLKNSPSLVVNWFGDDQWRFDTYSKNYANYFDACITTDKFSISKYKEIGQSNVIYSQWASFESNIEYRDVDYRYDVSFVGAISPYRKWLTDRLRMSGINVECFGPGWKNGRLSYSEIETVFSTSRINLNISNSTQYDIRFLLSSFRNMINFFRNPKNSSQIKARNFEIPTQGGFQITDYVPTLEEYFDLGREVVCYSSTDEVDDLIRYYLNNDCEREDIKNKGVSKARAMHTYIHRVDSVMKQLEIIYAKTK